MFNIYLKDKEFQEPADQIYYLLAANGLFLVKKTKFFTSSSLAFTPSGKANLTWLSEHQVSLTVHLPKKIPAKFIEDLINFFRAVHDKFDGAEAIGLVYWDESKEGYILIIPEQEVGKNALPFYKVGANPEGLVRIGTIHSHGSTKAFHSTIDHNDEVNDEGIHITIGNVNTVPTFSCSVVCDEKRTELNFGEVVELKTGYFPEEWLKNVKKAKGQFYGNSSRSNYRQHRGSPVDLWSYGQHNYPPLPGTDVLRDLKDRGGEGEVD